MNREPLSPLDRAQRYAKDRGLTIEKPLGGGFDGIVLGTSHRTAIKSLVHPILYRQERDVYLRLQELNLSNLREFEIPRLVDLDDTLQVIEMMIVSPPFVLDFAGAKLDRKPQFEPEIMEEWRREKAEQFEDDWQEVQRLIWAFERFVVYLSDVHPGNVMCR
uniref:Protein kinase domain-containing protein n=1 Tax=Schlesneria paludicola TaxID=360056 RepID=A0A7C2K1V4_9PLAN